MGKTRSIVRSLCLTLESWVIPYILFPLKPLLWVIKSGTDGSALGLPKAHYLTKNIFSSPGLEEPSGWKPILEQSEKHSLLLKTSRSDFLSRCGWTSPPLINNSTFQPAATEPGLCHFVGSSGEGCFYPSPHHWVSVLIARRKKNRVKRKS